MRQPPRHDPSTPLVSTLCVRAITRRRKAPGIVGRDRVGELLILPNLHPCIMRVFSQSISQVLRPLMQVATCMSGAAKC